MSSSGAIHIAYVMHPFGDNPDNLHRAREWCAFLSSQFDAFFVAPWIPLCAHWKNHGVSLDRAVKLNRAAIERFDSGITVGGKISYGMGLERDYAGSIGRVVKNASRFERPNHLLADEDAMRELAEYYGWGPLRGLERLVVSP